MIIAKAVNSYITRWKCRGYSKGIPEEIPARLDELNKAPSYKRIAIAIMQNDMRLLGVAPKKSQWYDVLKKIELNITDNDNQGKLF